MSSPEPKTAAALELSARSLQEGHEELIADLTGEASSRVMKRAMHFARETIDRRRGGQTVLFDFLPTLKEFPQVRAEMERYMKVLATRQAVNEALELHLYGMQTDPNKHPISAFKAKYDAKPDLNERLARWFQNRMNTFVKGAKGISALEGRRHRMRAEITQEVFHNDITVIHDGLAECLNLLVFARPKVEHGKTLNHLTQGAVHLGLSRAYGEDLYNIAVDLESILATGGGIDGGIFSDISVRAEEARRNQEKTQQEVIRAIHEDLKHSEEAFDGEETPEPPEENPA